MSLAMTCSWSDTQVIVPLLMSGVSFTITLSFAVWFFWQRSKAIRYRDPPLTGFLRHTAVSIKSDHHYESIIETVAKTLTDLHRKRDYRKTDSYDDVLEMFTREIVKQVKKKDATFPLKAHKQEECCTHQYEQIREDSNGLALDELYASFRSSSSLSKNDIHATSERRPTEKQEVKPMSFASKDWSQRRIDEPEDVYQNLHPSERKICTGKWTSRSHNTMHSTSSLDSGYPSNTTTPTKKEGPQVPPKPSKHQNSSYSSDSVFL